MSEALSGSDPDSDRPYIGVAPWPHLTEARPTVSEFDVTFEDKSGITLGGYDGAEGVFVLRMDVDGAAARSGKVQVNDRWAAVAGTSCLHMPPKEVVELIKQAVHPFVVTFRREQQQPIRDYAVLGPEQQSNRDRNDFWQYVESKRDCATVAEFGGDSHGR